MLNWLDRLDRRFNDAENPKHEWYSRYDMPYWRASFCTAPGNMTFGPQFSMEKYPRWESGKAHLECWFDIGLSFGPWHLDLIHEWKEPYVSPEVTHD